MAKTPLEYKDIVKLLSDLKDETPDYPIHLMSERKAAFLKKVVDIKISGEEKSGEGGQKGGKVESGRIGRSGAALSGGTFALGISLRKAIAIVVIIALLTAAYLLRDQIVDFLEENNIVAEETAAPLIASEPAGLATGIPTANAPNAGAPSTNLRGTPYVVGSPDRPGANGGQDSGPQSGVPTPPAPKGPGAAFRFLFCILQLGGSSCR